MRLRTREMLASETLARFKEQYENSPFKEIKKKKTEAIIKELESLGPSPNPDDVDKAIGNGSWTRLQCDICECYGEKKYVEITNRFEEVWLICDGCLKKAMELLA